VQHGHFLLHHFHPAGTTGNRTGNSPHQTGETSSITRGPVTTGTCTLLYRYRIVLLLLFFLNFIWILIKFCFLCPNIDPAKYRYHTKARVSLSVMVLKSKNNNCLFSYGTGTGTVSLKRKLFLTMTMLGENKQKI